MAPVTDVKTLRTQTQKKRGKKTNEIKYKKITTSQFYKYIGIYNLYINLNSYESI